jgi:3-methyladenine DNA glycosylase AlkC
MKVAAERLASLESGTVESRTHAEEMAMIHSVLLSNLLQISDDEARVVDATPFIARLRLVGRLLAAKGAQDRRDQCWVSDTVRGWFAMAIDVATPKPIERVIEQLLPFARDHHFAVREWAWLAIRPRVIEEPGDVLGALLPLFASPDPLERRFALEATRPRSVWGGHVELFKRTPEIADHVLDIVKCDNSRYVRLATANWINDAAKTRPDWAERLTARWLAECQCMATTATVRRGRRSLR